MDLGGGGGGGGIREDGPEKINKNHFQEEKLWKIAKIVFALLVLRLNSK
jgi:hypothetical protein